MTTVAACQYDPMGAHRRELRRRTFHALCRVAGTKPETWERSYAEWRYGPGADADDLSSGDYAALIGLCEGRKPQAATGGAGRPAGSGPAH